MTPEPSYVDLPIDDANAVRQRRRLYAYESAEGLVAGYVVNIEFTLEASRQLCWPHFHDFNLWQNSYGYYYSGAFGDHEGGTIRLGTSPKELGPDAYHVVRVIPEHLIVLSQPVPKDGSNGGLSPGFHVFMLLDHDAGTTVSILMQHALRTRSSSKEEALAYWRSQMGENQRKWRDTFVPNLRALIPKKNPGQ